MDFWMLKSIFVAGWGGGFGTVVSYLFDWVSLSSLWKNDICCKFSGLLPNRLPLFSLEAKRLDGLEVVVGCPKIFMSWEVGLLNKFGIGTLLAKFPNKLFCLSFGSEG